MTIDPNEESGRDLSTDDYLTTKIAGGSALDLDGDGKVSPWESNLCRICLMTALVIAFGDKVISGIV